MRRSLSMSISLTLSGLLLAGCVSGPQNAGGATNRTSVQVGSGRTELIANITGWDGQCRSTGYADVTIVQPPRNGRVDVRREVLPIPGQAAAGEVGSCAGQRIQGVGVYYTSRPGFQGTDMIVLRARPANENQSYQYEAQILVQ